MQGKICLLQELKEKNEKSNFEKKTPLSLCMIQNSKAGALRSLNDWFYWLLCPSSFVKELVIESSCLDTFPPGLYSDPSSSTSSATAARIENWPPQPAQMSSRSLTAVFSIRVGSSMSSEPPPWPHW